MLLQLPKKGQSFVVKASQKLWMCLMSMKAGEIYQFGEFQIDARARTLRREEEIVTLNFRAFDVLLYFAQNPGRTLTRDELLKNVWPDTYVDEHSLAQSISVLRRALDEKPGDNSFIVTLPGRGYQFVAPVQIIAPKNGGTLPELATSASNASAGLLLQQQTIRTSVITTNEEKEQLSLPVSRSRPLGRLVGVLAVAAVSVAGVYAWKQFRRVPPPMQPLAISSSGVHLPRRSIAVLGFRNLSGRPEEGWLSTALTEMLSTELEAGEKLRLVSGEDVARTKLDLPLGDADSLSANTLARLHKDMDSDLIVLGSYTALGEKPGTRIRLDLRLQDTVAGETIADVAVVGSEADLFDMVSQAGSRLREKLGVEAVSPVEAVSVRASLPSSRDAGRLYSEGLARLRVLDALAARDLLQQAVALEPKFSLAHSALAEVWFRLGYDKKAQPEARQAYELATNLSREEKLAVEGRYRAIDHEHEKAIEVYRTLFTLFPDNVDYGLRLATTQVGGSKGHDALATIESLRKLARPASEDPRIDLQEAAAWDSLGEFKQQEPLLARAVEKAKAQGARLVLAEARENQCWLFRYLGQTQNAVAACRESRDIFGAAGDRKNEARALRAWADAISLTDAPESIRLYQQAQVLFRSVGSQAGVAEVLNNLGDVYDVQGDPATAEKMERQALAIYRLTDRKQPQAAVTGNVAGDRIEQGDLRGALQLYKESLQLDPEDTGNVARVGLNVAKIHQLQGDLAWAKNGYEQSLATLQKNGDQDASAYAMWSLGSLLLEEADFSGARKMYGQALAIRTSGGDKLSIAETQLGLADLSLEEGHSPVEQEAAMRQAVEIFQKQEARDDETRSQCILARALLAEGKAAAASEAMQHARSLAAKSQNPEIRWRTAITAARIETTRQDAAHFAAGSATRKELDAIIAKSRELGYQGIELDARLALAEIEMKAGQMTAGRAHLTAIEADAKAKGYLLVARKAAVARR
jgi:DNA-binding winged helix-turn-helix (wHTH) protein/tetratricopeptide (TPR) repeat protein/TolB-like protein